VSRWRERHGTLDLWVFNSGCGPRNGLSAGDENVRVAEPHPRFRSAIHLKGGVIPLWHTDGRGCGNNPKQLKPSSVTQKCSKLPMKKNG